MDFSPFDFSAVDIPDRDERYPGFRSFKTVAPIRYPRRWLRDALLLSTFDNDVIAIAPDPHQDAEASSPETFRYVVQHNSRGRCIVGLGSGSLKALKAASNFDSAITVSRQSIYHHPYLDAAKAIWANKRVKVDAVDRMRILSAAASRPITVGEASQHCTSACSDPVSQVLSLMANGLLEFRLNAALNLGTSVWTRAGPNQIGAGYSGSQIG